MTNLKHQGEDTLASLKESYYLFQRENQQFKQADGEVLKEAGGGWSYFKTVDKSAPSVYWIRHSTAIYAVIVEHSHESFTCVSKQIHTDYCANPPPTMGT